MPPATASTSAASADVGHGSRSRTASHSSTARTSTGTPVSRPPPENRWSGVPIRSHASFRAFGRCRQLVGLEQPEPAAAPAAPASPVTRLFGKRRRTVSSQGRRVRT